MQFEIVDTQATYRRLLAAPDEAAREAIFREELVAPFAGLTQIFGGRDGLATFAQWGMSPQQFGDEQRNSSKAVLDGLDAANAWQRAADALARGRDAFAAYADRISLDRVVFGLFIANMPGPTVDDGYTGFGGIPGWIMTVYGKATPFNLERVEACTVHELHHNIWGTLFIKNFMTETTVADYMIMEGLAESFAAELYGAEMLGPWATRFDDSRLEDTKSKLKAHLHDTGFQVIRSYIFGDLKMPGFEVPKVGLPPYTGYVIGYRIVQAYLARHGGSVVDASFVEPDQIIAESGFFE